MAVSRPARRSRTQTLERAHAETLSILTESLPHLRSGLSRASAEKVAALVLERMPIRAVSIVDTDRILAFFGAGSDHHLPGQPFVTQLTQEVLTHGETGMVNDRAGVGCPEPDCPLTSAIVAPLKVGGVPVGCLKLYQTDDAQMGGMEMDVARSLARLFSAQLELADLDVKAARVAQAELEALRAQISPHFLFNTLTTIASLIRTRPERAHDLVIEFAEFFRETLKKHSEFDTLSEELDYVDKYLDFERARLGHRLQISREIEPGVLGLLVPVLLIQPLVENAVNHGLEPKQGGGHIAIRAWTDGPDWRITVEDDGVGMPPETVRRVLEPGFGTGLGMGLSNVNQRLRSLYGRGHELSIESAPGKGTRVTVRIPHGDRSARS